MGFDGCNLSHAQEVAIPQLVVLEVFGVLQLDAIEEYDLGIRLYSCFLADSILELPDSLLDVEMNAVDFVIEAQVNIPAIFLFSGEGQQMNYLIGFQVVILQGLIHLKETALTEGTQFGGNLLFEDRAQKI